MAAASNRANKALWALQIALALLFVMAGASKLVMSDADLTQQGTSPLSAPFIRFIGVCELLGAVGLVLPWALSIRPALTPLAAACLVVIMLGAVVFSALTVSVPSALIPLVVGVLLAYVGNARWKQVREVGSGRRNFA